MLCLSGFCPWFMILSHVIPQAMTALHDQECLQGTW